MMTSSVSQTFRNIKLQYSFVYCKLMPSVCNIHMMMSLVSQIFRKLSYNIHVSAIAYTQQQMHEYCSLNSDNTMNTWLTNKSSYEYCKQMVPTCSKQMNFSTLCTDIQLIFIGLLHSCSTRSSKRLLVCKLQHWKSSNLT